MRLTLSQLRHDLQKVERSGMPKVLFWAIINHCNAVCTSCDFYLVPKASKTHLSLDIAKRAIAILAQSDFRLISITGGEPFMNPDFFAICDAITAQGLEISYIPTNGLLVNEESARRLTAVNVKVVGVSVEPIGADGMGATRKIKNFEQVIVQAREHLDRAGVRNYAGVLLSRATLDIPKTMKFIRDIGFTKVVFSYPQVEQKSSYLAARSIPEVDLSLDQVESMVQAIKEAKRSFSEVAIYNTDESLNDLVRFYRNEQRRYPCWGGRRLFYMDWNLDVYKCFTLPVKYGNLLEMGKLDIEEQEGCDRCSQQAFRDFGPLYSAVQAGVDALSQFKAGHPLQALRTVTSPDNRGGIRAFWETYRGGFL